MRRSARVILATVAAVGIAAALSACASNDSGSPAASSAPATTASSTLAGTSWNLAAYTAPDGSAHDAVTTRTLGTLVFAADGSTAGSTGCNRFFGTYAQDGDALTLTVGGVTEMACRGPVAEQEVAVLAALPKVTSFAIDAGRLVLRDEAGIDLLTYDAALVTLPGTAWTATGVNNGKGGLESTAVTSNASAEFGEDGALTGNNGCNSYFGTYATAGSDEVSITGVGQQLKACIDPELSALEMNYMAALAKVATYRIEGNTLTLRDAGGAMQITYVRAAPIS